MAEPELYRRGCATLLASTLMAGRVYAAVGFRDLGRILEYVPGEREPAVSFAPGDAGSPGGR